MYLKDFTELDFFSLSSTNVGLPCQLHKATLYSEQPTILLARRHLKTLTSTNFENLNSISNIFQETHDFLVLPDPAIICIHLRTTDRYFLYQGNDRYPTSRLQKFDLVQTLNTFWNTFCGFLLPERYLLLNPHSGYIKIDVYLLKVVSPDFWRQIVTLFNFFES